MKKVLTFILATAMMLSLASCTGTAKTTEATTAKAAATTTAAVDTTAASETTAAPGAVTFDTVKVGTDGTGITASIKILSHRTDLVDTVFAD